MTISKTVAVFSAGLAGLLAGAVLSSFSEAAQKGRVSRVPKLIEAQEFVLKNAAGKVTARLHGTADGPQLAMLDSKGKPRLTLSIFDDGTAAVAIGEIGGEHTAGLMFLRDGTTVLSLQGANGSAKLAAPADKPPMLEIVDSESRVLFQSGQRPLRKGEQ